MHILTRLFWLALWLLPGWAWSQSTSPGLDLNQIQLNHTTFTLPNGLRVVVHEDHANPIVAVNLWYHVGSKNERPGKTGFAHLFEHLMFNGSEHYPYSFREAMDNLGATNRNGTTNTDRTNFYQVVPKGALERTLYLESDRMGWLLARVDNEVLERERGTVQNEKRQGENQPYGLVFSRLVRAMYPSSHPYSWTTIGEMEDLQAASLADVREWFQTYYGPANCVLSLSGDITPKEAEALVSKYFGAIPSGPPLPRYTRWTPELPSNIREQMHDRVPQARITRAYHTPAWGETDALLLDLAGQILSGSRSARLDRRLVYDKQLATSVSAGMWTKELTSNFLVTVNVKAGVKPGDAEREMETVLAEFVAQGPTADELQRAKTGLMAQFIRSIEGVWGRGSVLAEYQTFGGDAGLWRKHLQILNEATPEAVKQAVARYLTRTHYTMEVLPFPQYKTTPDIADRKALPALATNPPARFPAVQRAKLANGLNLMVISRPGVPLVQAALVSDAGVAADPADKPGLALFVSQMMTEGTAKRDGFALADELERLGASLVASTSTDYSVVYLDALKANADPSLALLAEVALQPSFPEDKVDLKRKQRLAAIGQEKSNPSSMALRLMPRVLYGASHPYGHPASGTEAAVANFKRADLAGWHGQWIKPGSSTLIFTGDISLADAQALAQKYFGGWSGGSAPAKKLPQAKMPAQPLVYILDKPGAVQSFIATVQLAPPSNQPDDLALQTVMRQFGGMATARLNLNLRMDKHWSYGYSASLSQGKGQRWLGTLGSVQTDKTKESLVEIRKELANIAGQRPIAGEEFQNLMTGQMNSLAGRYEDLNSLEQAGIQMAVYGYPEAYFSEYGQRTAKLTEADLAKTAQKYIQTNPIIWVVVGDRAKIEAGIRELNLGSVQVVDPEGNPVQ